MSDGGEEVVRKPDRFEKAAEEQLVRIFDKERKRVFYSRQLEIMFEKDFFHWITNRALHRLFERKVILSEKRAMKGGGEISLYWNKDFRYYRRAAKDVANLVEEYADPSIAGALGIHAELMVLEGFAKGEFVLKGRNCRTFGNVRWDAREHDLDLIIERDSVAYGVEVKNTLGYMDYGELKTKIEMCKKLGIRPMFVVRMLPSSWINEVREAGGFVLVLKYQLYPFAHKDLAKKVAAVLGLPVDSPRALQDGTMERFLKWHERQVKTKTNSQ
jgi:hypothetical protein